MILRPIFSFTTRANNFHTSPGWTLSSRLPARLWAEEPFKVDERRLFEALRPCGCSTWRYSEGYGRTSLVWNKTIEVLSNFSVSLIPRAQQGDVHTKSICQTGVQSAFMAYVLSIRLPAETRPPSPSVSRAFRVRSTAIASGRTEPA